MGAHIEKRVLHRAVKSGTTGGSSTGFIKTDGINIDGVTISNFSSQAAGVGFFSTASTASKNKITTFFENYGPCPIRRFFTGKKVGEDFVTEKVINFGSFVLPFCS